MLHGWENDENVNVNFINIYCLKAAILCSFFSEMIVMTKTSVNFFHRPVFQKFAVYV